MNKIVENKLIIKQKTNIKKTKKKFILDLKSF